MSKAMRVVFIGALLVLGLVACHQASALSPTTLASHSPTPTGPATVLPTPVRQPVSSLPTSTATIPSATLPPPASSPTVAPTPVNLTPLPPTVSGIVIDAKGPLAGAIVQIQGTANKTQTAENGGFTLNGIKGTTPIVLTAWSSGYYVGWVTLNPSAPDWKGGNGINITLKPLPEKDNSQYAWFSFEGVKGTASCGLCHREYKEWQADAHSQAAQNQRFITIYAGTNVNGQESQPVQWGSNGAALPPDPSQTLLRPGFSAG